MADELCGDRCPQVFGRREVVCTLPAGHASHRSAKDGTAWEALCDEVVQRAEQTEAVLAVRDDEVAALKLELSMAHTATDSYVRSAQRSAQSAAEHRRRADQAEAALAGAKALHSRDDSNPLGPWCGTCTTSWPCDTWTALDVPADGEQTATPAIQEADHG